MRSALDNLAKDPVKLAGGIALLALVAYTLARKTVTDTARAAGGVVTGQNAITEAARTEAYTGKGIVGTTGAAADIASGGFFSQTGEVIGGAVYGWFHPSFTEKVVDTYYNVGFPDGTRHAVQAQTVDNDGYFFYSGVKYRMALDENGNRWAVKQ